MNESVNLQALSDFEEVLGELQIDVYTYHHQISPKFYAEYAGKLRVLYQDAQRAALAVIRMYDWVNQEVKYINYLSTLVHNWVSTSPHYKEMERRERIKFDRHQGERNLWRIWSIRAPVRRLQLAIRGVPELLNQLDLVGNWDTDEGYEDAVSVLGNRVDWVMTNYTKVAKSLTRFRDDISEMECLHPELLQLPPEVSHDLRSEVYEAIRHGRPNDVEQLLTTRNAPEVLLAAVYGNELGLVDLVLRRHPMIDVSKALNESISHGSDQVTRALLDHGRCFEHKVHIDALVESGDLDVIAELYRRNLVAEDKYTRILPHSVVSEYPGTTLWLLENYPEQVNEDVIQKVFNTAVTTGKFEIAETLINRYQVCCQSSTLTSSMMGYNPKALRWLYRHCQSLFTRENIRESINMVIRSRTVQVEYDPVTIENMINTIMAGNFPNQLPFANSQCVLL